MSRHKASHAEAEPRRPSRREATAQVVVKNVNVPGHRSRVNLPKDTAMRRALLSVLPTTAPGLTQAGMFQAVLPYLPGDLFPGGAKANWWAKTVQLEAKRLVAREHTKPLRWHRI